MYNNYGHNLVKVTTGVFKGITGDLRHINMSASEDTMVEVIVNSENIIKVRYSEIENLCENYLIYEADSNTQNIIEIIGIRRLVKKEVGSYIERLFQKKYGTKHVEHDNYLYITQPLSKTYFCATPLKSAKFKLFDKSVSYDELKKIFD